VEAVDFPSIKDTEETQMFYTKTQLPGGKVVKTEITDENVYTHCPDCGRELSVDLVEVIEDGEGDLVSTSIICSACTRKRIVNKCHAEGISITADGLAWLVKTLCVAGYGEQVSDLLEEFEITSVFGLKPDELEMFADALQDLIPYGGDQ